MAAPQDLPFASKIALSILRLRSLLTLSTRLLTSPFKGSRGAPTYYKDVMYSMIRTNLYHPTLDQVHQIYKPTTTVYLSVCKARGFQPDSITLPSGVQAHYLAPRKAEKLVLWFHGGGFVCPAAPGQVHYYFDFMESLNQDGPKATSLLLAYDCAPAKTYPSQLIQGVELVQHMIDIEGWDPSNILLAGDSAGANLSLGIISHVLHPHPSIAPLHISKPFHAAVLISPWVSFSTTDGSFRRNEERDIFYPKTLEDWSSGFLGTQSNRDNYSEPIRAPPEWWKGAETVVGQVLIWGGEWEVLIDGIRTFATKFEQAYSGKLTVLVTSRAAHEDMVMDTIIGIKEKGEGAIVVEDWVRAKL